MLKRVTFAIAALACAVTASAETIRLKNGRSILADSVREVGEKVEYTIGEDTYAIRKSSVERIDTGGTPVVTRREAIPAAAVELSGINSDTELESRLIRDGKLDLDLLAEADRQPPPERAASANFLAARHMQAKGDLHAALDYIRKSRAHLPMNAALAVNEAALLNQSGQFREAASVAQRAVDLDPKLGAAHNMLGYSFYQLGELKEAIRELKTGTALDPDENAKALLAKAERENSAEGTFDEQSSSHFALKYEGGRAAPALRQQIIDVLERHFQDLTTDLDYVPKNQIQVILYTDKQYFDVTQAPRWSGALNDGKLRLPISGLTGVDSNLSRVLKHELTHSFINLMTNNRAPNWLHEGVAQLEESRTIARDGVRLSQLYNAGQNIPLNQLEASFSRYSDAEATVAYAQSLASAEFIRDVYGMSSITFMLKRLGEGQSTEAALRAAVHSGYAGFDRELAAWLKKTYE